MNAKWALLLLLVSTNGYGDFFNLQEVSVNMRAYLPGSTDPLLLDNNVPNSKLNMGLDLTMNTDIATYFYWNNTIHSLVDKTGNSGQFRAVGWLFTVGVRPTPWMDIEFRHHSQHAIDAQLWYGYPCDNSVGITLYLYRQNFDSKRAIVH